MKRTGYALLSLLAVATLSVAGCSAQTETDPGEPAGSKIGLSMPNVAQEGYVIQKTLTEAAAAEAGLELLQTTDAKSDPGRQISDVRNLITAGAQGIIVTPGDSEAIAPALEFAAENDVPIIATDVVPTQGTVAITVVGDNYLMGKSACEQMGERLGGKGKVLEVMGDLAILNGRERNEGFNDCIAEKFPDIEVISRPAHWKADEAAEATEVVLAANPDLAGLYVHSDCGMLAASLNVLQSNGKTAKVGEDGHIVTVSVDGCPFALEQIRAGLLDAAISQPINLYATYGVDYLKRAMAGETFEEGPTEHGSEIKMIYGNPTDLLPSPVVTIDNVDDDDLFGNL